MKVSGKERLGIIAYLLLFAVQMFGSDFIIWKGLPAFRELVLNPGEQMASTPYDGNAVIVVLFVMQGAYWYRLRRVAIPFRGRSLFLSHLFLFLGRLKFIFGSALFSIGFLIACSMQARSQRSKVVAGSVEPAVLHAISRYSNAVLDRGKIDEEKLLEEVRSVTTS
jgi:hypothetical protein